MKHFTITIQCILGNMLNPYIFFSALSFARNVFVCRLWGRSVDVSRQVIHSYTMLMSYISAYPSELSVKNDRSLAHYIQKLCSSILRTDHANAVYDSFSSHCLCREQSFLLTVLSLRPQLLEPVSTSYCRIICPPTYIYQCSPIIIGHSSVPTNCPYGKLLLSYYSLSQVFSVE